MSRKPPGQAGSSPEELLALLDALPANVALWDAEVRLRYANKRQASRFGRPESELLGARLAELVSASAVELSAPYIDGALAGYVQQVERATITRDGLRRNAHQVTHVPDVVDGRVLGYCALAVDITTSIEGYEEARRAREQSALRAARARIVDDIDSNNVVDELGGALERLDAAVGRASELVPSLSRAADVIDHAISELRATVPSSLRPSTSSARVPFPTTADEPADVPPGVRWPADLHGADWSAADVTAVLDLLPAAVAVWDGDLRNVFANRCALEWAGLGDRAAAAGQPARELLGVDLFETASKAYAEASLRGEPRQIDRSVKHLRSLRHLQVYCCPRLGEDGAVDGLYTFVVDLTARVEAELALQDARAELASMRERERIAADLHNLVIQRLFAAGLAASRPRPEAEQVEAVQDGIVAALDDLQSALSSLHGQERLVDLLPDLARVVHAATDPRGLDTVLENVGSLEYVPPDLGAELLAAAEAAVTGATRRSGVTAVVVTVAADQRGVWLRVVDDGRGLGTDPVNGGLADLGTRASRLGGSCTWRRNVPSGTVVDWRIPLPR